MYNSQHQNTLMQKVIIHLGHSIHWSGTTNIHSPLSYTKINMAFLFREIYILSCISIHNSYNSITRMYVA